MFVVLDESSDEDASSDEEMASDNSNQDDEDAEKSNKNEKDNVNLNEYENDSSDEEDLRNTIGNVPEHWYDDEDHIGYNLDGKKIMKPSKGDELDNFLNKMDNPNFGITVHDPQTGQVLVLSLGMLFVFIRVYFKM